MDNQDYSELELRALAHKQITLNHGEIWYTLLGAGEVNKRVAEAMETLRQAAPFMWEQDVSEAEQRAALKNILWPLNYANVKIPPGKYRAMMIGCATALDSTAKILQDLAKEYHERCEEFDKQNCQFCNEHGIAVPVTPRETWMCSANAMKVRREIMAKAERQNISRGDVQKAISHYRNEND